METINVWATLMAALSVFILGGIWYAPPVFGNLWKKEAQIKGIQNKDPHPASTYIFSLIFSWISAIAFACYLGKNPELHVAIRLGFLVGLCWVSTSFGINYLFTNRNWKLLLIDAGYHIAQFILYGLILGLWH